MIFNVRNSSYLALFVAIAFVCSAGRATEITESPLGILPPQMSCKAASSETNRALGTVKISIDLRAEPLITVEGIDTQQVATNFKIGQKFSGQIRVGDGSDCRFYNDQSGEKYSVYYVCDSPLPIKLTYADVSAIRNFKSVFIFNPKSMSQKINRICSNIYSCLDFSECQ